MSEICQVCGLPIAVGEFPCITRVRPHARGMYTAIGDECDVLQSTGAKYPIRFRSKQERLRWLKEHGYREVVKNAGPDDQHCPPWNIMDPQTLANGEALAARSSPARADEPPVRMRITQVEGVIGG